MKKALIVDDAGIMRAKLREILETKYYVIAEASTGTEAVELYEKYKPDFVTMDISMPDMNGIEALEKIKNIDPEAKVVMISAAGQIKNVYDCARKGAKTFIVKPFEREKVIKEIDKLFIEQSVCLYSE